MIIYIVETPLQLLCAFEVMRLKNEKRYKLLIRLNGKQENDRQTITMAGQLGLKYQTVLFRNRFRYIDVLAFFHLLPLSFRKFDTIYYGSLFSNFLSLMSCLIKSEKEVFLDDGVATFLSSRKVAGKRKSITLFTFFNLEKSDSITIIPNDFSEVRAFFCVEACRPSTPIFIGQKVVEAGMMSKKNYLSAVLRAQKEAGGEIDYIPHRDESEATTGTIASMPGVTVIRPDCCIEMYLLKSSLKPSYIASTFSSALFSLGVLFPDSKREAWLPSTFSTEKVPHYAQIIDGLSNCGVTVKNYNDSEDDD